MNIVPATTYQRPMLEPVKTHLIWPWIVLAVLVLAALCNVLRPLPAPVASVTVTGLSAQAKPIVPWMQSGQSAIAAPGYGILGTYGKQTPLATASITKVILALCILDKQPLALGTKGPTYTVSAGDVAIYNNYVAENGSVAAVTQGEKLTQYQALQALLLPSANNIADSLARWVFGSQATYAAYATNYLLNHQINQTSMGTDASGYDPSTTSTATDLTKIGLLALKSPVLLSISSQKTAELPVAGTVTNYNTSIGVNGITGLKTGNNDQDPGAFLFTAKLQIGDKTVPATGAVMGATDLQTALNSAAQLAATMKTSFSEVTVAKQNQQVGTMRTAWGAAQPIITANALQVVRWNDTAISETHKVAPATKQGAVGSASVSAPSSSSKTKLLLPHDIPGPSFVWRLTRH